MLPRTRDRMEALSRNGSGDADLIPGRVMLMRWQGMAHVANIRVPKVLFRQAGGTVKPHPSL